MATEWFDWKWNEPSTNKKLHGTHLSHQICSQYKVAGKWIPHSNCRVMQSCLQKERNASSVEMYFMNKLCNLNMCMEMCCMRNMSFYVIFQFCNYVPTATTSQRNRSTWQFWHRLLNRLANRLLNLFNWCCRWIHFINETLLREISLFFSVHDLLSHLPNLQPIGDKWTQLSSGLKIWRFWKCQENVRLYWWMHAIFFHCHRNGNKCENI